MKKILLITFSFILMLCLAACSNESTETYTFKGKIVEKYANSILVEPLENEDIKRSAYQISIEIGSVLEFNPEIFSVGDMVEIEYDGNIRESFPAQVDAISIKTIDDSEDISTLPQTEIPTTIAYANWIDTDVAFESDENCLNLDKYVFSDYPRLPVFKFDTKSELDEFKNKYKDVFTMNQSYNEVASFNDVTENYDDEFFNNHSLILTYQNASSGSFRYGISEVKKDNGVLILKVTQTNNPETYTENMSGWFLMAEVEKDYIKDCKEFDAQQWD